MARDKIQLSVEQVGDKIRYRKMHKGQRWQSSVYSQDSRRNRSEAWAQFAEWRESVNDNTPLDTLRRKTSEVIDLADSTQLGKELQKQSQLSQDLAQLFNENSDQLGGISQAESAAPFLRQIEHRIEHFKRSRYQGGLPAQTSADHYLETLKAKVKAGQASTGLYGQYRAALTCFVEWYGKQRGLESLTEQDVTEYHQHLMGLIGSKSQTTIHTYQKLWRSFVENICEDNPDLVPPRNLRSKRYIIKPAKTKVETFTIDECKTLLKLASPRVELWLLLMLNTGATQQDISDLNATEVDWDQGRIVRARSKEPNAPTINWLLWDRAWELLEKQGKREGLVLLKGNCKPLVTSGIKDNGKEWRRDAIVSSWRHLVDKAKKKTKKHEAYLAIDWHKTLKQFRKTSASLMETSPHAEFVDVFLDHSRVARRHYLKGQVVPKFDEAVKWLGEQFGLETSR